MVIPASVIENVDLIVERFNKEHQSEFPINRNNIVSYALQKMCADDFPEIIEERHKDDIDFYDEYD